MDPLQRVKLGPTKMEVTRLGFGGGTLGDPSEITSDHQAELTIEAAFGAGVTHFDTSPWYGNGKSEHRTGRILRTKPRDAFVLSTKVGRVYKRPADPKTFRQTRWAGGFQFDLDFDYTRAGIQRSYEQSLMRLGMTEIDALLIHDLDRRHQKSEDGVQRGLAQLDGGGGYRELTDMKARGEISAIGAGVNHTGMIPRFLERFDIDFFLVAMPHTLTDQEMLDDELPLCVERGASVIIGAPFASGILATGVREGALYRYQPATPEIMARVKGMEDVCARHGVPLAAAALQFPFGHPAVASVIPGPNSPEQFRQINAWMRVAIPDQLWADMKSAKLIAADAPTPRQDADCG
ncbi:MAG TPA: aldo/keto reductase [Hyphomicrobiaceae bacterium]|nr:aldo/keto reductase [Hyphomicrobiaceae bacterium]